MAFVRPKSLAEVARMARIDEFFPTVREFLDSFYGADGALARQQMLEQEPQLIGIAQYDAYVGAVAEHLAIMNGLDIPAWSRKAERFLDFAYFPSEMESLKATFLKESPAAFRRRMIFVDADPLVRPSRAMMEEYNAPTL